MAALSWVRSTQNVFNHEFSFSLLVLSSRRIHPRPFGSQCVNMSTGGRDKRNLDKIGKVISSSRRTFRYNPKIVMNSKVKSQVMPRKSEPQRSAVIEESVITIDDDDSIVVMEEKLTKTKMVPSEDVTNETRIDFGEQKRYRCQSSRTAMQGSGHRNFNRHHSTFASSSSSQNQSSSKGKKVGLRRQWHKEHFGQNLQRNSHWKLNVDTDFTLMSYNVLADQLVKDNMSLYQGVPKEHLDWEKRYQRLLEEILSYKPDILCLQEVQSDHYESHFLKDLTKEGYVGVYKQRTGDKQDGCATFIHTNKFILEDTLSVEYNQPGISCLDRDNIALLVRVGARSNIDFRQRHKAKETSVTKLVVANTHLLFNPNRQDVKLAQTALLLAEMDRFATPLKPIRPISHMIPCIVAGDFNLVPDSPVFNLLTLGEFQYSGLYSRQLSPFGNGKILGRSLIPPELGITDQCQHFDTLKERERKTRPQYQTGGRDLFEVRSTFDICQGSRLFRVLEEEPASEMEGEEASTSNQIVPKQESKYFGNGKFSHRFGLRSVHASGRHKFCTTNQNGWVMVDYIFYSTTFSKKYKTFREDGLKLISKLRLPSREECEQLNKLPNEDHPSDHFPLIARFLLKGIAIKKNKIDSIQQE